MTTSQYATPAVSVDWANSRNTHMAVATAIHAISDDRRDAQLIWENPTIAEWDHVAMAVENYVMSGEFHAENDGRYAWGDFSIYISDHEFRSSEISLSDQT